MSYWIRYRKKGLVNEIIQFGIGNIIINIANFASLIILSKSLGPSVYGHYIIIITAIAFITTIVVGWASIANLRFYERFGNRISNFLFTITIALAFLITIIDVLVLRYYVKPSISWIYIITFHVSEVFYAFIISEYRARNEKGQFFVIALVRIVIPLLQLLTLLHNSQIKWIFIIGIAYNCFVILAYLANHKIEFYYRTPKWLFTKVFKYGFPLSVSVLFAQIISLSDRFFLEHYFSNEIVGIYSAYYRIAEMIILFFSNQFLFAIFPYLIRLYEKNEFVKVQNTISELIEAYYIMFIPIIIFAFYYGQNMLELIFGDTYKTSSKGFFGIVSLGVLAYAHSQIIGKKLELLEKSYYILFVYISAGLVNIVLNFFIIPKFSLLGAAIATLVSYIFILISFYVLSREKLFTIFNIHFIFYFTILIIPCHIIYNLNNINFFYRAILTFFLFSTFSFTFLFQKIKYKIV